MKYTLLIFLLLLFGFDDSSYSGNHRKYTSWECVYEHLPDTNPAPTEQDTFLLGDINADHIKDTAFVIKPKDPFNEGCPNGYCQVTVTFSNGLPAFTYAEAIFAEVYPIGDVDQDGISELMFCPGWFQGCWGNMGFYSFKNQAWYRFGEARGYLCEEEKLVNRVKILNRKTIKVLEDVARNNDYGDIVKKYKKITLSYPKAKH